MGASPSKVFGADAIKVLSKTTTASENGDREITTVAGGCFWGIELAFQRIPGVVKTEVGYCQGQKKNPTYEEVCSGQTGHTEAVQITFDPNAVSFEELLDVFWDIIDPTTLNQQGNDVGSQYRSGIYFHNDFQKDLALKSRDKVKQKYADPIVTEIEPLKEWYPAEEYHQQYLSKGGQCSRKGDLTPIRCYG